MQKIKKIFLFLHRKIKIIYHNKNILYGSLFLMILMINVLLMDIFPFMYYDPTKNFKVLQTISWQHWMGTDAIGYDLFSRVLAGAKISLFIGFFSVLISSFIGTLLGIIAGYFRGFFDYIINFLCDFLVVFPEIILAIMILFFLSRNTTTIIIVLSISQMPTFIRIIRANILKLEQKDFIKASKALGSNDLQIIIRHILPNIWEVVLTQVVIAMSRVILSISALGFVGLGLDPTQPEWGNILNASKSYINFYPHLFFGPFFIIFLTSLSFNLISRGMMKVFNHRK